MAKTARLKKHQAGPNSRAARRAESPSINLDKSLTTAPRPSSPTRQHILRPQPAGIAKKTTKQLSRQQRQRQNKAAERADAVFEKLEIKVLKSVKKSQKLKERKKGWETVNGTEKNPRQGLDPTIDDGDEESIDEDMDNIQDTKIRPNLIGSLEQTQVSEEASTEDDIL